MPATEAAAGAAALLGDEYSEAYYTEDEEAMEAPPAPPSPPPAVAVPPPAVATAGSLVSAGRDSYYSGVSAASASSVSDGDGESLLSGSVSGDDYDVGGAGSLYSDVR